MDYYEDFFVALDEAIHRAGSIYKLAKLSGLPLNSISRWQKQERNPTLDGITKLLPFMEWPRKANDTGAVMKRMGAMSKEEPVESDDLRRIPIVGEAGAGNGVEVFNVVPEKFIEILPQYYRKDIRALEVTGDSMEPTIMKGAVVGVSPFTGTLQEGSIYLCHLPYFGSIIKRVRANGLTGMVLISDNQDYPPVDVPYDQCENLIIGKVEWIWQKA